MSYERRYPLLQLIITICIAASLAPPLHAQPLRWVDMGFAGTSWVSAIAVGNDGRVLAGTVNDGLYVKAPASDSWVQSNFAAAASPVTSIQFFPSGEVLAASARWGMSLSTDGGLTWRGGNGGGSSVAAQDIVVLPSGAAYVAFERGIRVSTNMGGTWKDIGPYVFRPILFLALAINPNNGAMITTTIDGELYSTTNGGADWHLQSFDLPNNPSIVYDEQGYAYAGSTTLYRSIDDGQHWTPTGLSSAGISDLAVDRRAGAIYAATREGIARSTDAGEHWEMMNDGIEGLTMTAVTVGADGSLWAASADSRVFRATTSGDVTTERTRSAAGIDAIAPNPTAARVAITYTIPTFGPVRIAIINALGVEVAVLADRTETIGTHTIVWNAEGAPAGSYRCRLETSRGATSQMIVVHR